MVHSKVNALWEKRSFNSVGTYTCRCNSGFNGDGRTCSDVNKWMAENDVISNPCPSTDCWTYDESTQTCTMKPACATLTWAAAFDITFKSALFDLGNNQCHYPFGAAVPFISPMLNVVFSCTYSMTMDVASQDYSERGILMETSTRTRSRIGAIWWGIRNMQLVTY